VLSLSLSFSLFLSLSHTYIHIHTQWLERVDRERVDRKRIDRERHTQASPADYARHYSEKLVSAQLPLSLRPSFFEALL